MQIFIGREPREVLEVMDKVRLVVKTAFQGDLAPTDGGLILDGANCLLEAHDLQVLFGRNSHLPFEQVDEVFLRIADLLAEMVQALGGRFMDDAQ